MALEKCVKQICAAFTMVTKLHHILHIAVCLITDFLVLGIVKCSLWYTFIYMYMHVGYNEGILIGVINNNILKKFILIYYDSGDN